MAERRISESEIEAVLVTPHTTDGDGKGNRNLAGIVNGRRMHVVLRGDPPEDPPLVITVTDL